MLRIVAGIVGVILVVTIGVVLGQMLAPLFPKNLPAPLAFLVLLVLLVTAGMLIWAAGFVATRKRD